MSEPMSEPVFLELTAEQTHPLRLAVLRFDTASKQVVFPQDDQPGVVHLGVALGGELVGTSTWVPSEHDGTPAVQLRGMATARHLQGAGLGGLLLEEGCARQAAAGRRVVWANARDAALAFYERHGFVVEGNGFVDETTQLPHHRVVRRLD